MLDVYYGEFLTSPCPLELSFNACIHRCAYCFANLNQPDRRFNAPATARLLANYRNRHTLTAYLLQAGYPVVVSNRCDPFSANNYRQALPILEIMTELGIPIQLQTKGGYGIDTALRFLKPAVWYITIETHDDALSRRLSPGSPPPTERWSLVHRLIELGHGVVIGLNPYVPEWTDPAPIIARAREAGVWGIWIELLHLDSKRQVKRLTPYDRETLGEAIITKAKASRHKGNWPAALDSARAQVQDAGLEVFSNGQPIKSNFWDIYRRFYPRTFPTLQDYVNTLPDDPDLPLEFEAFAAVMLPHLPAGEYPLAHYLGATGHDLWRQYTIPPRMTYRQLLSILWQEPTTRYSLTNSSAFAFIVAALDGDVYQVTDETGLPCLSYGDHRSAHYHQIVV